MDFKGIKLPPGSKLCQVHSFVFLFQGVTFALEVNEYHDGQFSGYGEQMNDESKQVSPVSGNSVNQCLEMLIQNIQKKSDVLR